MGQDFPQKSGGANDSPQNVWAIFLKPIGTAVVSAPRVISTAFTPSAKAVMGLIALAMTFSLHAAEIFLSSGVTIEGVVIAESPTRVVIATTSGTLAFPREKVLEVKRSVNTDEKSIRKLLEAERFLREGRRELAAESFLSIVGTSIPLNLRLRYEALRKELFSDSNVQSESIDAEVVNHAQKLVQREQREEALNHLLTALQAHPNLALTKRYFLYLLENDFRKRNRYCFYIANLICGSSVKFFESELNLLFERALSFCASYAKEGDFFTANNYAFLAACVYGMTQLPFELASQEEWCSLVKLLSDVQRSDKILTTVSLAKVQLALLDLAYEHNRKYSFLLRDIIPRLTVDRDLTFQAAIQSTNSTDWRVCAQLWACLEWAALCAEGTKISWIIGDNRDLENRLVRFCAFIARLDLDHYARNPIRACHVKSSADEARQFLSAPPAQQWQQILLFFSSLPEHQFPTAFVILSEQKVLELAPTSMIAKEYFCPALRENVKRCSDQIPSEDPDKIMEEVDRIQRMVSQVQCADEITSELAAIQELLALVRDIESRLDSEWRSVPVEEKVSLVKKVLGRLESFAVSYGQTDAAQHLSSFKNRFIKKTIPLMRCDIKALLSLDQLQRRIHTLPEDQLITEHRTFLQACNALSSQCLELSIAFPDHKEFRDLRSDVETLRHIGEAKIFEEMIERNRQHVVDVCQEYLQKQPDYDEIRPLWLDKVQPLAIGRLLSSKMTALHMDETPYANQARVSYVMTFLNAQKVPFENAKVDIILRKTNSGWKIASLEFLGVEEKPADRPNSYQTD